ncbi:MAG: nucleotidyl transferase AbiEii/AbiGii toxin family protein [Bifidobacteriaceae bacterium]|nr:nucleotidyl transferase AbiEii/AbiGii toxin family protein [Bifidobacteriaceae bacterium]
MAAVLQQALDEAGNPRFLLKGGTLLQHRLPGQARATADLDGPVRGDLEDFLAAADPVLRRPWGPLTFRRGPAEAIDTPTRVVKPRRFDVIVQLGGVTWRRIQVEASPDEGAAGASWERLPSPSLAGFGLPTPDHLVGLAMRYQAAEKVHASTDPHDPAAHINDRARAAVDLVLIRGLSEETGEPPLAGVREAIRDVFAARAAEAATLGRPVRRWPARLVAHPHWDGSFGKAARSAGLAMTLPEAVAHVNSWLDQIDAA